MRAWERPELVNLPGQGRIPKIFDSQTQRLVEAQPKGKRATLYVCGITPYDATHLGHAFTYLTYDTLIRAWRDCGVETLYAQNVTDIDEPLFERANQTGVDWKELGERQINLFREDMRELRIVPPDHFIAVTEAMSLIRDDVQSLVDAGFAYQARITDGGREYEDFYFDVQAVEREQPWRLGDISHLSEAGMIEAAAARGGDPFQAGKRSALDPCLWRESRPGEPTWPSAIGGGRPGWHIECASIALHYLGSDLTVQGGGADLQFPHHEMSASHAQALAGCRLAGIFSHSALVSYQGEKMSKSLGNLVFVSHLRQNGYEPDAIRLALLQHHYRTEWEWFDGMIIDAVEKLQSWRAKLEPIATVEQHRELDSHSDAFLTEFRRLLSQDLDTPSMVLLLDEELHRGKVNSALLRRAANALLGLRL